MGLLDLEPFLERGSLDETWSTLTLADTVILEGSLGA